MAAERPLLVSRAWVQAAAIVLVFGFFVLGLLAYRTYAALAGAHVLASRRAARRRGNPSD